MRTLIIPDIHNHTENADYWLGSQRYDRVVFLGDYFDDFGDDVSDATTTAFWLKRLLEQKSSDEAVFLLGNHDAAYMCPDQPALECPGFTRPKWRAIQETLGPGFWNRLKLAHPEDDWLLSHAGFHPVWMEEPTIERVLERCELAMKRTRKHVFDDLLGVGRERGGAQPFGGPLWMDWECLVPIPGIHQIVGHTPGGEVRTRHTAESQNYCLDVRNGAVAALLEEGELTILERDPR